MKISKKLLGTLLLGLACTQGVVFAQPAALSTATVNQQESITITVEEGFSTTREISDNYLTDNSIDFLLARLASHDLSRNSYSTQASYSSSVSLDREFINHGGRIKVKLTNVDTDRDHNVTVKIYKNGTYVDKQTVSIGKKIAGVFNNKTVTFDDLDSSSKYTIQLVNNGSNITYNEDVVVSD